MLSNLRVDEESYGTKPSPDLKWEIQEILPPRRHLVMKQSNTSQSLSNGLMDVQSGLWLVPCLELMVSVGLRFKVTCFIVYHRKSPLKHHLWNMCYLSICSNHQKSANPRMLTFPEAVRIISFGRTSALGGEMMVQKSLETLVNCGIKLPTLKRNGNTYPTLNGKFGKASSKVPLGWDMYPFPGRVPIINWLYSRISKKPSTGIVEC